MRRAKFIRISRTTIKHDASSNNSIIPPTIPFNIIMELAKVSIPS